MNELVQSERELSDSDFERLGEIEAKIERISAQTERGRREIGLLFLEIRDSRNYLKIYSSFDTYCKERWGITRRRADQIIQYAKARNAFLTSDRDPPKSERFTRELLALAGDPEGASEIWSEIVDALPEPTKRNLYAIKELAQADPERPISEIAQAVAAEERVQKNLNRFSSNAKPLPTSADFNVKLHDAAAGYTAGKLLKIDPREAGKRADRYAADGIERFNAAYGVWYSSYTRARSELPEAAYESSEEEGDEL